MFYGATTSNKLWLKNGWKRIAQSRRSFQGFEVFKKCTLRSYCRPTTAAISAVGVLLQVPALSWWTNTPLPKGVCFNKKPNKDQQRSWVIKSKQHMFPWILPHMRTHAVMDLAIVLQRGKIQHIWRRLGPDSQLIAFFGSEITVACIYLLPNLRQNKTWSNKFKQVLLLYLARFFWVIFQAKLLLGVQRSRTVPTHLATKSQAVGTVTVSPGSATHDVKSFSWKSSCHTHTVSHTIICR